jgi:hypothetical protein
MAETIFTFSCPCCGKMIEVDTRSGKARAVRPDEAKGGRDLDQMLKAHSKEQERLGDLFRSASEDQQQEKDRLARQLARAKEEAKKDKDKDLRPRNPFDLD